MVTPEPWMGLLFTKILCLVFYCLEWVVKNLHPEHEPTPWTGCSLRLTVLCEVTMLLSLLQAITGSCFHRMPGNMMQGPKWPRWLYPLEEPSWDQTLSSRLYDWTPQGSKSDRSKMSTSPPGATLSKQGGTGKTTGRGGWRNNLRDVRSRYCWRGQRRCILQEGQKQAAAQLFITLTPLYPENHRESWATSW